MIKSKEDILASIKERIGEDASDEALTLLEDITDTFTDLETKAKGDGKDWKAEAARIDAEWRAKYRDRFFGDPVEESAPDPEPDSSVDETLSMTFEKLFEEKE